MEIRTADYRASSMGTPVKLFISRLRLGPARQQPKHIGKPVQVNDNFGVRLVATLAQGADSAFRPPARGPREIKRRGQRRRAGSGPAFEGDFLGLEIFYERI